MHQYDELIDEIANRVMASLRQKKDVELLNTQNSEPKKTYSIIGNEKDVKEWYESHNYVKQVIDSQNLSDELIITQMTHFSISRLSNNIAIDKDEETVLRYLARNQRVILIKEGFEDPDKIKNNVIKNNVKKQLVNLKKMGLKLMSLDDFLTQNTQKSEKAVPKKKKLYTMNDLVSLDLSEGDTLYINSNTIITALAEDYLKDLRVTIERGE